MTGNEQRGSDFNDGPDLPRLATSEFACSQTSMSSFHAVASMASISPQSFNLRDCLIKATVVMWERSSQRVESHPERFYWEHSVHLDHEIVALGYLSCGGRADGVEDSDCMLLLFSFLLCMPTNLHEFSLAIRNVAYYAVC